MRTTLTLEPDIERKLKDIAARKRKSFKEVVNETLKAGLKSGTAAGEPPFRVKPHRCGFKSGVDPARLNQLYDELEIADFVAENPGDGA